MVASLLTIDQAWRHLVSPGKWNYPLQHTLLGFSGLVSKICNSAYKSAIDVKDKVEVTYYLFKGGCSIEDVSLLPSSKQ